MNRIFFESIKKLFEPVTDTIEIIVEDITKTKITNPEHTSQIKLIKDPDSKRVNDLLTNKIIPVTVYNTLLTFRDLDKKFELQQGLLKMMTNKNHNVDLPNLPDK